MTYEAWRISYQSSEQAARAAYSGLQSTSTRLHEAAVACANAEAERDALRAELDALRAWKEEIEKQEPVGVLHVGSWYGDGIRKGVDDALPKAQELAANARLIAAAPDLLEALKRCKFDSLNMTLEDCEFCRAAFAKATGEQP